MSVKVFRNGLPEDFKGSTDLPESEIVRDKWQNLNKSWWEQNPMRYDFNEQIPYDVNSQEYFTEIDKRFHSSVFSFMPWKEIPFDPYIDYSSLPRMDVLEIGVGCGSNAQLLARRAKSFTGIDITNFAVHTTSTRLQLFQLPGIITQMDAENMAFDDNSFDFIWSWGVIHHSSNIRSILGEMHRILRPGGIAVTMVYHRSLWNTYIRGGLYYGMLRGWFLRTRSLSRIIQESTDGALARYYTISEWEELVSDLFKVERADVYGSKSQIIPFPYGKIKQAIMDLIPDKAGQFLTNRPSMGFLLVSKLRKAG
jgi:ubiquinone/menaquinone biosynthesis C-methylase UbiE